MGKRSTSDWNNGITIGDVQGRDEAARLARTDIKAAFLVARKIAHPWYRCQALTALAKEIALPHERLHVLMEAFDAAYEQPEPNRIACVGAWPLRELVAIDHAGARSQTDRLLATISTEPHGLRRLDGLRGILGAVLESQELREFVLPAFSLAADASTGWRTERIVWFVAEAMAVIDLAAARELLCRRGVNRFTSKAVAALDRLAASAA